MTSVGAALLIGICGEERVFGMLHIMLCCETSRKCRAELWQQQQRRGGATSRDTRSAGRIVVHPGERSASRGFTGAATHHACVIRARQEDRAEIVGASRI